MALFRRKQEVDELGESLTSPAGDIEQETQLAPRGPYDADMLGERGSRLDLGAIWLPGREGLEVRMEVDKKSERVTGVAVKFEESILQLQAFAAPKRSGIWDEIRAEIAESITGQGGTVDDVPGAFGRELLVKLPVKLKDGQKGIQPARFVGFDGPRWFLRGVFSGRAAFDQQAAAPLEEIFSQAAVVRGTEPRPPRDLLELKLPGRPAQRATAGASRGTLPANPLQRGPEITEVR